jgi:hypothetical protein
MNCIKHATRLITASLALLVPAHAGQNVMENAKALAAKAHQALKDNATADKGGHRVAAMKHLQAAIAEIEAGIAFDKANQTKSEGKKRGDKKKK